MSQDVYLHDANLVSLQVDAPAKTIRLLVMRHPSPSSPERVKAIIEFTKVESMMCSLDFLELAENAWAGNIEDWEPSEGFGTSRISFVRGALEVRASEPNVLDATD